MKIYSSHASEYKSTGSKIKNKCYILEVLITNLMQHFLYKIILIAAIVVLISGCGKQNPQPYEFNGKELSRLTNSFLNGDSASVSLIGFLFSTVDPKLVEVNELVIDSITMDINTKFYYLILEARNPAFNLYAVIDNKMNVLLKDNSLNGNLTSQFQNINNSLFQIIQESFTAKDTFKIQKTSFYEFQNSSVNLSFRTITAFNFGKSTITSTINEFDDEKIRQSFSAINTPQFKFESDEFLFESATKRYISENNYLRNYARDQIQKYKSRNGLNEITDQSSFYKIFFGETERRVTTEISKKDYSIFLTEDWREFENFAVTKYLKNEFRGNKYVNEKLGATISIVKLPERDSADSFIDYKLNKNDKFQNQIRYADLIEIGKLQVGFYEYYCAAERLLLIIEFPKFTYDRNSQIYHDIIRTFKVNC